MANSSQFVFITGGVVSSLGKGIVAASLGSLLEKHHLKVTVVKMDPYLNIDPGTMSPYQHGEVFVTKDGAETDLDLGHYERFINIQLTRKNNFTAGQIYETILQKERKGDFLGGTVQIIPHVTDEIKARIQAVGNGDSDIVLCEVGGTVGDIESQPFLEALRQLRMDLGVANTLFVHLTWLPYIDAAGELKTKPTQYSVKELRSIGIHPDILVCRSSNQPPEEVRKKVALFTNVDVASVIPLADVVSIYQIPLVLHNFKMDQLVVKGLSRPEKTIDLSEWQAIVARQKQEKAVITIGMVGKYTGLADAYLSLNEALEHAGIHLGYGIQIEHIDAESLNEKALAQVDGIIIPGGFGTRGIEGKIVAAQYARENKVPFLGICLGMQVAIIEYCRHVLKLADAHSSEFSANCKNPVIGLISEWMDANGQKEYRNQFSVKGGTMRLGEQRCILKKGSLSQQIYGQSEIAERHRHRYEVNNAYCEQLKVHGMEVVGTSMDGKLVEMIEIQQHLHPWFIASQFHPEFTSDPRRGHPLFSGFINAARCYQQSKQSHHAWYHC